ncbi:MAG: helix-turn-helix domain-containing protein [Candidatus Thermoplasmatota archaeon]
MRIFDTVKPGPLRPEAVAEALVDTYVRRILVACVKKAKAVRDISQEAGLPLPTTYRQVHRLVDEGLLVVERIALTSDGKKYALYRSRIRSARIEMDGSGERVAWEPNEAVEARLADIWDSLRFQAGRP